MKTMKKAISVLLLVCMVSALCSAGAYATGTAQSMKFDNVSSNMTVGQEATDITVSGYSNTCTNWEPLTSSNSDVIQIISNNSIKAVGVGVATIYSKCWNSADGAANYDAATEKYIAAQTITVSDPNVKLTASITRDGYTLTAHAQNGGTDVAITSVTWTCSGKIDLSTADGATATIKQSSEDISGTVYATIVTTSGTIPTSIDVNIPAPAVLVADIVISASSTQITAGTGSVQMNVDSITPDNANDKTYAWSVTGNATIDVNGVVRTNDAAAVNDVISVKAIANDAGRKESNTVQLTVVAATIPATSLTINSSKGNVLTVGDTTNLTATASPSGSSIGTVTWSGSNAVADVNASTGVVTAKSAGKVTVTATANDTVSGNAVTGTYEITVNPVAPTSVTVTPSEATIELSTTTTPNTKQLTATVLPDNAENKTVIWSSSNTAVATVTADTGVVTAVSKGTAVITATVKDTALTSACTVTVTEPAAYRINLTPNTITLGQGNVNYFTATILDKDGKNVSGNDKSITWSFTGDTSDGIGITSNGYNSANSNYTATVLGKFNRNYVVTASCSIGGVVYSSSASVTVSFTPAIVSGQNAVYNGRDAMSFVVNDSAQNFNGHVYVDGRELSNVYYSTSNYNGYLVVTLNQSFLNFLCQYYNNNGYHTLSVDTKYGAAASYFRTWGTASSFNGVKTGDDANLGLWAALLAVSAVGAGAAVIIVKRRKTNNG